MQINDKTPPPPKPKFTPKVLELVFESQEELDDFGSFFNNCGIAQLVLRSSLNPAAFYNAVRKLGGNIYNHTKFSR